MLKADRSFPGRGSGIPRGGRFRTLPGAPASRTQQPPRRSGSAGGPEQVEAPVGTGEPSHLGALCPNDADAFLEAGSSFLVRGPRVEEGDELVAEPSWEQLLAGIQWSDPPGGRSIRSHDVDVARDVKGLSSPERRGLGRISLRVERDQLAVGRPRGMRVVLRGIGQPDLSRPLNRDEVDL